MNDIDEILEMLRSAALPDKLLQIDGAALAAIGRARSIEARNTSVVAAAMALVVGVMGSALPPSPAKAAMTSPFGLTTPLAPSTLLASQP